MGEFVCTTQDQLRFLLQGYSINLDIFCSKYCSDTLGNQLENFAAIKTNTMSLNMNCNCARVRSMLLDGEKPECCINGNYKQVQRRRGLCRCVDSNGVQIEKEVDCTHVNQLSCFNMTCHSE
ncbi:hypothetical protein RI129_003330 [Pyrocoelia pectoralis]|uniref:Thyroglobulin type-1 domain-containing protein n=1 Tax=Pyrocoelia pectoralis TaxID=417401 RepID=A0AAN7VQ67_9COLE